MKLREHTFKLKGDRVFLRPMTENDWAIVTKWETDPEILYWADTEPIESRTLEEVQTIFRTVSQYAYCFIIEFNNKPVGDCWLQEMNLERILKEYPGKDCRRIDLVIGEKGLWGRGIGTDVIRVLTRFAFGHEKADMVFGISGDYNKRSQRAFKKSGYRSVMKLKESPPSKARYSYVLAIENRH
ncbi:MAG: GNAT family N-acetyltransferase [Dehalococcoidales bacterium]|nr:GNAT family N-acetyltransferase [Dehalococcoidales bacterium]